MGLLLLDYFIIIFKETFGNFFFRKNGVKAHRHFIYTQFAGFLLLGNGKLGNFDVFIQVFNASQELGKRRKTHFRIYPQRSGNKGGITCILGLLPFNLGRNISGLKNTQNLAEQPFVLDSIFGNFGSKDKSFVLLA